MTPKITPERIAELLALDGYTPGPWIITRWGDGSQNDSFFWNIGSDEHETVIAEGLMLEEARLIAAAPELHAALAQVNAENERLREAALFAIEIIKDSWGEDQIEAGDDQACNVLIAALNPENSDAR